MKQLFTILCVLAIATTGFSQGALAPDPSKLRKAVNVPQRHHESAETRGTEFYLDYDYSDLLFYGGDVDPDAYQYFIWNLNNRYSLAEGDTNWTYGIVGFDRLYDYQTAIEYDNDLITGIRIDSIFINLGHENNSGQFDTLIVKIIKLSSNGYPQTGTSATLWSDTLTFDFGLSPSDWFELVTLPIEVNFTTTEKRFGVRFEYYDPSKLDTFGIIAGWGFAGDCGTSPYKAYKSTFYPNSYNYWMAYDALLPTSGGGFLYYDCNQSGAYEEGDDGEDFIQNWSIWARVELDPETGVEEITGNISGVSLTPNPSAELSQINFSLLESDDVKIGVYDLAGKMIYDVFEGNLQKGKHQETLDVSALAPGMYMVKVESGNQNISKRLVVTE